MKKFALHVVIVVVALLLAHFVFVRVHQNDAAEALELSKNLNGDVEPNTDFRFCADGSPRWRIETMQKKRTLSDAEMHKAGYRTCINTVTGFFNPYHTCAMCVNFVKTPWRWGFREIDEKDAAPGDVVIMCTSTGRACHAVIIDSFKNGKMYFNHSNGRVGAKNYRTKVNYKTWVKRNPKIKSLRYYRYDKRLFVRI